jgi:hypothetical protein
MEQASEYENLQQAVIAFSDAERLLTAMRMILDGCDHVHERFADPLRGVVDSTFERVAAAHKILEANEKTVAT